MKYDDTLHATTFYTYGTDIINIETNGVTSYYIVDGQGSTRALTNAVGLITDTYTYDAFGNLTEQTGDTENSFLYCGEQYDANTGFYYLRARYMDPSVGRFVTMDPYSGSIFDPISLHKYLYANSNPIAYTDPTGYFSLAEMDVCTTIQNILDNATKVNYVKIFNTINDALSAYDFVRTIYDSVINAESIEQVAMSLAIGAITSVAINKCAIFQNPLVKKIMSCMFATMGIAGEAQGIYEAIENEDYDLAITRSVQLAMTLTSALFFNCFTGETLVATEDGQKRIDEIEVGDLVWSANVETGEVELKEVKEVFVREDNVLVHLTVNGNVINTTALHPFYVVGKGWAEAVEIEAGDKVLLQDGTTVIIESKTTEQFDTPVKVYNFSVNDFHTYFVGEDCVLVHNANYHKHHSDPKYLGGDPKQPLTNIEAQDHINIHKEMDIEFPRRKGTQYYKNKLETDPKFNDEVIDKLTKIYKKWSDKYPTLLDDFLKNRKK